MSDSTREHFTDRDFWADYWRLFDPVPTERFFLSPMLKYFPKKKELSFLEIGGFPGRVASYLRKKYNYDTTILDIYVDEALVNRVEECNGLQHGSINLIEGDLFTYKPQQKYDVVSSFGLIEHFVDTKLVLQRHINFMHDESVLLVAMPNLRGLNGWIQKYLDRTSYDVHNIEMMDVRKLTSICRELDLRNPRVFYFGKPSFWIDNGTPTMQKAIATINRLMKYTPSVFKGRLLSSHIVICAYP